MTRLTAAMEHPLTLVNGPAGAGKTVLTADWVTAGLAPPATVWLTVEPGDAPGTFWAYALEALARHDVKLPAEVGRPTRAEGVDQSFLVRLAGGLAESAEPVVLVLDQVDTACGREITEGLQFVLHHAADGLRLVLTGRTDPLLPLHRYRAAGEITEIRNADLRFTRPQATVLLQRHGLEISEAGLRLLLDRTDGWAAGLRLCALAMQQTADPEAFVREFAADRTTIADYLLTEVLDAQPPPTQDLLLRTCITDRIHPELADSLTGRDDADGTLAGLARANAFLEQVDGTNWYRLHPLFAEVLRAHLRHRCPGLEPVLHERAARWLAGAGRLTDAVTQAAAAGDWQFAADQLVGNMAIGRLFTGLESEQLRRTLAAMPTDLTGAAPALVMAACRLVERDLDGCTAGLRQADKQLTDAAGPASRLSRELVGVLAGRLAHDLKATEKAAAAADQLLHALPAAVLGQHPEIRAMVLTGLGVAELAAGHLDRAGTGLTAAVEACDGPGTEYPLCDALGSLALVELLRGRLRQAEQHARGSGIVAERSVLSRERRTGLDHLVLAGVATEHDDLRNARTQLDLSTAPDGPMPEPVAEVTAAVIAARLATAEGDWEGALAVIHAVGATAAPLYLPEWTADELAIAESWAQLAHGDPGAALDILDASASDRPEHTVARARAMLAAGHSDQAMETLAGLSPRMDVTATIRTQACLLQAQAAAQNSSTDEAQRFLFEALACARPEKLRRVFVESGPWVRRLLRQNPRLARTHDWLPAHLLGSPGARSNGQSPSAMEPLSERESEVLRQAARMLSTDEIAAELYVSANTVKTHLKSIYRKLSVTRRSEAVHRAQDLGIL
ncbi:MULTISPECIES: LuxR C-terminal-related transcriptional regulator [unclassified Kitasatospora]|uniref:LuxR C-terminal-related transcriptional regulator n=1 Tax=unclassified Kitasatospora TaxID=2633591 RepID=UPI002473C24D|nr:LuxR C-terminal-related transcriptional regulator [Kitasatospora sp. MAP12-44]